MRQHEDAVPGHGEVGLERCDADFERTAKPRRVFSGSKPARAAVALQVECHELAPVPERHNSGQDQARAASPHGASPHGDCVPGVMPAPECLGLTTARCQKGPPHHDEPDPAADPPRQAVRQPDAGAGPDLAGRPLAVVAGAEGRRAQHLGGAPAGEIGAARPITNDSKRGIRFHGWAYDGTHVLYMQDEGGTEDWHIYAVAIASGESRDLTPLPGVQARIAGAQPRSSRLVASPSTTATRPGTTSTASTSARASASCCSRTRDELAQIVLDRQLTATACAQAAGQEGGQIVYRVAGSGLERDRWSSSTRTT